MHLALAGLFQARWTEQIHEEWIRSLHEDRPELSLAKLERVRCLVLPDPGDRHILAAPIQAKAGLIVTYNLADFPASSLEPYGIKAEHLDAFVVRRLEQKPERVVQAVRDQR